MVGGLLICDSDDIALKTRLIRDHGEGLVDNEWPDEKLVNVIGMNFGMTEFEAQSHSQVEDLYNRNQKRG